MTHADLHRAMEQANRNGTPVKVTDPATQRVYYLVPADQFKLLESLAIGDVDPREAYPLVDTIMEEDDARDPLLQSYQ
jgi:hypothetical protein